MSDYQVKQGRKYIETNKQERLPGSQILIVIFILQSQ